MARRFNVRSTSKDIVHSIVHGVPWRLLILIPILILLAIPTFIYGTKAGNGVLPSVTNLFYKLSTPPTATPVPLPPLSQTLPVAGSIMYSVQSGDSCDSILAYQMNMADAGQIFSDAKPQTVTALNAAFGHNCGDLQPGMTLPLSPQYPLVAMGGVLLKVTPTTVNQQAAPTPLIPIQSTADAGPDCTGGCTLVVRVAPSVQVKLQVTTALSLHVNTWVWFQAMLARKNVSGFSNYPYADPYASMNNMTLPVCDFQAGTVHDDNSYSCDQLSPNTIDDDGGAWLLGVMSSQGLEHWHYNIKAPTGSHLLIWLENDNGNLTYHAGDPVYRYDASAHIYVKL